MDNKIYLCNGRFTSQHQHNRMQSVDDFIRYPGMTLCILHRLSTYHLENYNLFQMSSTVGCS